MHGDGVFEALGGLNLGFQRLDSAAKALIAFAVFPLGFVS